MAALGESLNGVGDHMKAFKDSQSNWVDGISDFASVGAAAIGAAAAPFTFGGSLALGAAIRAGMKVGVKGLDAMTGSGHYDGSVLGDLAKGGFNGMTAVGSAKLADIGARSLLKAAGGEGAHWLAKAGVFGGVKMAEGAAEGFVGQTFNGLVDGKTVHEATQDGLRGAAVGSVANLFLQSGGRALGKGYKAAGGPEFMKALGMPGTKTLGEQTDKTFKLAQEAMFAGNEKGAYRQLDKLDALAKRARKVADGDGAPDGAKEAATYLENLAKKTRGDADDFVGEVKKRMGEFDNNRRAAREAYDQRMAAGQADWRGGRPPDTTPAKFRDVAQRLAKEQGEAQIRADQLARNLGGAPANLKGQFDKVVDGVDKVGPRDSLGNMRALEEHAANVRRTAEQYPGHEGLEQTARNIENQVIDGQARLAQTMSRHADDQLGVAQRALADRDPMGTMIASERLQDMAAAARHQAEINPGNKGYAALADRLEGSAREAVKLKDQAYDSLRTHGYRELPPAQGDPTALHLTTRTPEYLAVHDNNFTRGMAPAIGRATGDLQAAMARGDVSPQQVRQIMNDIGRTRQDVKFDDVYRRAEAAEAAGEPWTAAELRKQLDRAQSYGNSLNPTNTTGGMLDTVPLSRSSRHRAFFDRADRTARVRPADGNNLIRLNNDVLADGTPMNRVLSSKHPDVEPGLRGDNAYDGFAILHPNHNIATQISDRAMDTYARILNDPNMTESQAMLDLARANYLMMHGTPYELGTPAIVESMNDAVMRARFNKTFPNKRVGVEPFWEAQFQRPGNQGMEDYAKLFRDFFE